MRQRQRKQKLREINLTSMDSTKDGHEENANESDGSMHSNGDSSDADQHSNSSMQVFKHS